MNGFWESNFKSKTEMWGWNPVDSASEAANLFSQNALKNILIPGFGYGRNAKVFYESGFNVTGIEISETAIEIAKHHFGDKINVHLGSVSSMPFDDNLYDGIFCYALLHLLTKVERYKFIENCYNQLNENGFMVFVTLSKKDSRYGKGTQQEMDTFLTTHGITLFFYDEISVHSEFHKYGLVECKEIQEPKITSENKLPEMFYYIICQKVPA